jgi:hypothetical protein
MKHLIKNTVGQLVQYLQGEVRAIAPNVEETREIEFVISTGSRDAHHTRMNMRNWRLERFNKNPIVGYQHNVYGDMCNPPDPDDVIGAGRAMIEGDQLIGVVRFEPPDLNEKADKIFRKVLAGTLKATSVGIMPLKDPETNEYGRWGEGEEAQGRSNETFYFYGQELLEFSIVNIPSNSDAVRRSMRDQTAHALMYMRRVTGLEFADIERLTIRDVLDALEGKYGSLEQIQAALAERNTQPSQPSEVAPTTVVDAATRRGQIVQAVRAGAVQAAARAAVEAGLK